MALLAVGNDRVKLHLDVPQLDRQPFLEHRFEDFELHALDVQLEDVDDVERVQNLADRPNLHLLGCGVVGEDAGHVALDAHRDPPRRRADALVAHDDARQRFESLDRIRVEGRDRLVADDPAPVDLECNVCEKVPW